MSGARGSRHYERVIGKMLPQAFDQRSRCLSLADRNAVKPNHMTTVRFDRLEPAKSFAKPGYVLTVSKGINDEPGKKY